MESMELIKLISEFGVLIVIAGLYLYERFMENRNTSKTLGELKELLTKIKEEEKEHIQKELTVYNFRSVLDLYLTSQLTELIKEMDDLIAINHIHTDEDKTREKIDRIVRVAHKRHRDYINELVFRDRQLSEIIDSDDFIQEKVAICTDYVLSENPLPAKLWRALNACFERFKLSLDSDII